MFIDYLFTYLFLLLRTWTFCANLRLLNFSTAFIPMYFNPFQCLKWWWRYVVVAVTIRSVAVVFLIVSVKLFILPLVHLFIYLLIYSI